MGLVQAIYNLVQESIASVTEANYPLFCSHTLDDVPHAPRRVVEIPDRAMPQGFNLDNVSFFVQGCVELTTHGGSGCVSPCRPVVAGGIGLAIDGHCIILRLQAQ